MKREPKQYSTDIQTQEPEPGHKADASADSRQKDPESSAARKKAASRSSKKPAKQPKTPRKMTKEQEFRQANQRLSTILSIVFFSVLLAITIFLTAAPRTASSQAERQSLPQWPAFTAKSLFDGSYARDITRFYNDVVPARDTLRNTGNRIRSLFGIPAEGTAQFIDGTGKTEDLPEPEAALTAEEGEELTNVSSKDYHIDNEDVIAENGYLVVLQDGHWRAFSFYTGADVNLYAGTINYIRQMIDPAINIYVMPAPLACQFYIPANYLNHHEDMELTFRDLTSKLGSGITAINIIEVLNDHNTEPAYLRTDHHWAPLGAYYAASAFAQQADVPFAELGTYEKITREDYVGTMYALTGSANLLHDPENFVYYIPANSYIADYYDPDMTYLYRKGLFFDTSLPDSYGVTLGEDDLIIRIITDAGTGRKLLMVKDSFGNAAVPFLTSSFDEIYVVDQRYFNYNLIDYINSIGITDILFLHDYYSLTGSEAELLEYITYSNLHSEIHDTVPKPELPSGGNPDLNGTEILFAEDVPGYRPPSSDDTEEQTEDNTVNSLVHEIYDESFYENHDETSGDEYEEGNHTESESEVF